jgi:hypothetical protein
MAEISRIKARPDRIRVRFWDAVPLGAIPLSLPPRRMWPAGLVFAAFFALFAAIEWTTIANIPRHSVRDVADLVFVLFRGFWVLGWSVGVAILGALTILLFFYGESARLQGRTLVYAPRLGPVTFLVDYDLAKVHNIRLERAISNAKTGADTVRVRFDYGGGTGALGDTMPRPEGQRIVDAVARAASTVPPSPLPAADPPATSAAPAQVDGLADVEPAPPLWSASGLALVSANLLPLFGVLFFGWDIAAVMVLFWVESAVIAFYTILKMAVVGKLTAIVAVPFFVGHFGGFMAMHFLFIYMFFLRGLASGPEPAVADALRGVFTPIWTSVAALVISHGVSFFTNFIGRREYNATTLSALMSAPYHRIVVMQITVIFGGWIVLLMKSPGGALVLLIVAKTMVDFWAHRTEHGRMRKDA